MTIDARRPISSLSVTAMKGATFYPEPFAQQVRGRVKKKLGDLFRLTNFGVNLTQLEPGSVSALLHSHTTQDEFIYVLEGTPTLVMNAEEYELAPGDCMGFKAGTGIAHQLANRSDQPVTYLEIGDRSPGDAVEYPNDDLKANLAADGSWAFTRKDGTAC
ncbi:MAG: cupin domain-containing protein [Gammaproteobacteria bacterium]|nr:cupin domain-containing protein [Gammaproteobacteria bacterium]